MSSKRMGQRTPSATAAQKTHPVQTAKEQAQATLGSSCMGERGDTQKKKGITLNLFNIKIQRLLSHIVPFLTAPTGSQRGLPQKHSLQTGEFSGSAQQQWHITRIPTRRQRPSRQCCHSHRTALPYVCSLRTHCHHPPERLGRQSH